MEIARTQYNKQTNEYFSDGFELLRMRRFNRHHDFKFPLCPSVQCKSSYDEISMIEKYGHWKQIPSLFGVNLIVVFDVGKLEAFRVTGYVTCDDAPPTRLYAFLANRGWPVIERWPCGSKPRGIFFRVNDYWGMTRYMLESHIDVRTWIQLALGTFLWLTSEEANIFLRGWSLRKVAVFLVLQTAEKYTLHLKSFN